MDADSAKELLKDAYIAEVQNRGRRPVYSTESSEKIGQLADLLTTPSPTFGFMLSGNVGNGKTTLLYAFQTLLNCMRIKRPQNGGVESEWDVYGIRIVDAADVSRMALDRDEAWKRLRNEDMLAIEDMGKEPTETMSYGNVLSPITELMEYRYDKQLFTAVTTNLTPRQISEKYGERIADRFREMFCKIVFKNDSYRS